MNFWSEIVKEVGTVLVEVLVRIAEEMENHVRCEQGYHAVLSEEPCYVWSGPVRLCRRGFAGRCRTAA